MSTLLVILGIVLFIFLIVAHEFGHFMVARRNGVVAEEFGIFFPPRLFKKRIKSKKGDWNFTINLLPLGGFVKMKGEHDSDTSKGSFGSVSLWSKSKIMIAGVVVNLVIAVILFTILALIGMPKLVPNQFTVKSDTKTVKTETIAGFIEPNSPASKTGLVSEDRILAIGPTGNIHSVTSTDSLFDLTEKYAGQKVDLVYSHDGQTIARQTTLRSNNEIKGTNEGHLGVATASYELQRSTWSAPVVAIGLTGQFTKLTFVGLGQALKGLGGMIAGFVTGNHMARETAQTSASSSVAGPVGIFYILKSGSSLGYRFILMIVAVISLTLAIMNILPIPALDGGRLWWTLFAHAIKKPMSAKVEEYINGAGFVLLIGLVIIITIADIVRFG